MAIRPLLLLMAALLIQQPTRAALQGQAPASPAVDFEYFRTKVQPIFLARRDGHTRCSSCHMHGTGMHLQELSPGATAWNEEQSRQNFAVVAKQVQPRDLRQSRLLLHPLATEAGGTFYHTGGKHWSSVQDPEWQTLARWVCGLKTATRMLTMTDACVAR